MKVNNLIKNPKWKKFYKHDELNIDCTHCAAQKAEDSIPKQNFVFQKTKNKDSKSILSVTIKEINIVSDSHDVVLGWNFQA